MPSAKLACIGSSTCYAIMLCKALTRVTKYTVWEFAFFNFFQAEVVVRKSGLEEGEGKRVVHKRIILKLFTCCQGIIR